MNCEQVESELRAFLSGQLSGVESATIRAHLARCSACASGLGVLDRIEVLPAFEPAIEPSEDLDIRFRERLREHRSRRAPRVSIPLWDRFSAWTPRARLSAAGAVAALLLAVIYFGSSVGKAPEPAAVSEFGAAENLPLLEEMAVINNLDLLEDLEVIEDLDRTPASQADRN